MKNECMEYAQSVANELKKVYDGEAVNEDGEAVDVLDYINENALEIEYTLDSRCELIGVTVYVTLGGPTCWIDTRHGEVVCKWGSESGDAWVPSEICDEINEIMRECFAA